MQGTHNVKRTMNGMITIVCIHSYLWDIHTGYEICKMHFFCTKYVKFMYLYLTLNNIFFPET